MPLLHHRRLRKRWRWAGAFADNLIVFAADAQVGPGSITFWGVWDRERRRLWERTRRGFPGRRPEVRLSERTAELRAGSIRFDLEFGEGTPIECMCPNDADGYTWTRKLGGMPVRGEVRIGSRVSEFDGRGVLDQSAGYHARHTRWCWSAGVGTGTDGRSVAWNLVSGINDPPAQSERTIWVNGRPMEPGPVDFQGLDAIQFEDGSRLRFKEEVTRTHRESMLIASSDYEAPFGSFTGSLLGLELESALGVMERHDAVW